jgi:hypothetical protein
MTNIKDLAAMTDKKLRTVRNNLNNRLTSFEKGNEKNLPPSHVLSGMDLKDCKALLTAVHSEMKKRNKLV